MAGARLISSASTRLAKIGPRRGEGEAVVVVEQLDRLVQFHFGAGVAVTASLACGISSRKSPHGEEHVGAGRQAMAFGICLV